MQRFTASDAKYAYSPEHASIGTVQPGEPFEVESVEGFSNYFRSPADFTPERYAEAEAVKWAVTGPISVAGAKAGGAVAVTIHDVDVTTPGVVVYGGYTADEPLEWWDDESACELYPAEDGSLRFDERTTLPTRPLIGCLAVAPAEGTVHAKLQGRYGGNMDCRELRAGATLTLPVAHDGGGLYFGDCKALMGDGEIVGPPEVGALVTASAEPRERPALMEWPRIDTGDSLTTLVSGKPLEWSARQAFRELLNWVTGDFDLPRPKAALLLAMVAQAGICQISNTDYTAYCTMPRDVLEPYAR
jgi:acetamidase/formamidase